MHNSCIDRGVDIWITGTLFAVSDVDTTLIAEPEKVISASFPHIHLREVFTKIEFNLDRLQHFYLPFVTW